MKNEQGFSLVELLIVVAIIAIIAAIAVPSLLTSRQAANEASGMQACRTYGTAEIAYSATNNQQFGTMAQLVAGNFCDSRYQAGVTVSGYQFSEDIAITDPQSTAVVGGAAPNMFGFLATAQAGTARYDYEIGTDQVVRWGPVPGVGKTTHDPVAR
jgi:type IV pilus assembly protein PilA